MIPDFSSPEFKAFLKLHETAILDRTPNIDLIDSSNFKRLRSLITAVASEAMINGIRALVIANEDIEYLAEDVKSNLLRTLTSHEASINDLLRLDRNLNLIGYE